MRLHLDAPFIVIPNIAPPSDVAEGFYLGSQATQSQMGQGFVGVRALVPWRDRTFLRGGQPSGHHLLSGDHHSHVPVQLGCTHHINVLELRAVHLALKHFNFRH